MTIDDTIYLKECLEKRLLPFMKKHHEMNDVLFWPNMATCHYKNDIAEWLKGNYIDFIDKPENVPNVPQAHQLNAIGRYAKWHTVVKKWRQNLYPCLNKFGKNLLLK